MPSSRPARVVLARSSRRVIACQYANTDRAGMNRLIMPETTGSKYPMTSESAHERAKPPAA